MNSKEWFTNSYDNTQDYTLYDPHYLAPLGSFADREQDANLDEEFNYIMEMLDDGEPLAMAAESRSVSD